VPTGQPGGFAVAETLSESPSAPMEAPGTSRAPKVMTKTLWLVGFVILVAGILFGYDQGVIAGALDGIQQSFHVSTLMTEIITSWVTLGALGGALVAGMLADKIGRRPAVLLAGVLFMVGALVEAFTPGTTILIVGRLIVGFAVGVASVAAPLYAAEMAPTRLRGRFISSYQFGITFGIFVAYFIDELIQNGSGWRLMLGLSGVAAVILVVAILPLRDTPRWYLKAGRTEDAKRELAKITVGDITEPLAALEADAAEDTDQATWKEVFSKSWRTPLLIGLGLAIFQQITGINAIIYYADKIFGAAGFTGSHEQASATTWAVGAVNVLATLIAIVYVDRLGRRALLLTGLVGMGVSLTVVGACFFSLQNITSSSSTANNASTTTSMAGIFTLVALIVYIASFAFSLGPVVWTMINEIYPRRVRGRAVSIATAANWAAAWLVSQFFLTLVDSITEAGTFLLFALMCVVCFVWIWRYVPETKGRTLEEIEAFWKKEAAADAAAH
jgi:sugar porter (SP) family MFS transporter